VFAIKSDGRYRARLVARGFSQVPGLDFTENFAPVMQDATLCVMLMIWAMQGYDSAVFDVETAFLYGKLDEEIYMKVPEGYKECGFNIDDDEVLELLQAIYGLVQAARQWWKCFMTLLEGIGCERRLADPCLVKRIDKNQRIYVGIHVDDASCVGHTKAIEVVMNQLKERISVKILGSFSTYLGCEIVRKDKKVWITQPK
jgi:hypothetical protein